MADLPTWTDAEVVRVRENRAEDVPEYVTHLNLLAERMAAERQRWERMAGRKPTDGVYAIDFEMAKVAMRYFGMRVNG